jgi:patatin-related protein
MAQQHEIRLALVMNGGVSLAVWMGGVTHELDLIRRATTAGTPPAQAHDLAVAERWRALMQHPGDPDQRRLVIDVIAGTSAGGLNGALLANAIAYDSTLDPSAPDDGTGSAPARGPWLREQWCSLGSLRYGRLIPDPDEEPPRDPTGSLLDGDFFYQQAHRLLTELAGQSKPSSTHPVTLFTTASGLGRQEFTAHDAAGQPFTVTDHRFLYRISNQHVRHYDPATLTFDEPASPGGDFDDIERLALAARSSASFPVAFAPRSEGSLNDPGLRQRPRRTGEPSWLMDGGVLDNAPFGPVLETVAAAPVAGHVSRYVMYVVPSSGIGKGATEIDPAAGQPPSWKQTALSALQFPREIDFRSDVEELEALRIEADTAWSDTQHAFAAARDNPGDGTRLLEAAKNLQPTYTRGRAAGGIWEALTVAQAGHITALDDSASAPARDVQEILDTSPRWTPPPWDPPVGPDGAEDAPVVNPVAPFLDNTGGDTGNAPRWPWGMGPAERVVRTILRALRAQTATAFRGSEPQASALDDLEARLATLTDVRSNLRAIRHAVGVEVAGLGRAQIAPTSSPATVANAINRVFDELRVQEALGQEVQRVIDAVPGGADLVELALALEVVERCMSSRTPDQRSAPFKFIRLGPDVPLPVLSAADQERASRLGDRIIYGT